MKNSLKIALVSLLIAIFIFIIAKKYKESFNPIINHSEIKK